MAGEIVLIGKSGREYLYHRIPVNNWIWHAVPGNYALIGPANAVLYVGQTENFSDRQPGPNHEKWNQACGYGLVSIFARVNHGGEEARLAEEKDLIHSYSPPCNIQNQLRRAVLLAEQGQGWGRSGLGPLTPRKRGLGGQ